MFDFTLGHIETHKVSIPISTQVDKRLAHTDMKASNGRLQFLEFCLKLILLNRGSINGIYITCSSALYYVAASDVCLGIFLTATKGGEGLLKGIVLCMQLTLKFPRTLLTSSALPG